MANRSSIPAWRIPWTEGPGGLQSMGSQRVRHDLVTKQQRNPLPLTLPHLKPWPNEFVAFLKGQEFQWQWWDPQVVLGPGPHPCLGGPPLPNPLLHTSALGSTQGVYRVLTVCSLHQGWPLLSPLWAAKQDGPLRAPCPEAALW